MTEAQTLLELIKDRPDVDDIRLRYADAVQEEGNEDRAQFIRVQVEYARGTSGNRCDQVGRLPHELLWCAADGCKGCQSVILMRDLAVASGLWEFLSCVAFNRQTYDRLTEGYLLTRGFYEEIRTTWEMWERVGDDLTSREWVPKVHLTDSPLIVREEDPEKQLLNLRLAGKTVYTMTRKQMSLARGNFVLPNTPRLLAARWPGTKFELVEQQYTYSPASENARRQREQSGIRAAQLGLISIKQLRRMLGLPEPEGPDGPVTYDPAGVGTTEAEDLTGCEHPPESTSGAESFTVGTGGDDDGGG